MEKDSAKTANRRIMEVTFRMGKLKLALLLLGALIVGVVIGATVNKYVLHIPQEATVSNATLVTYVDGKQWTNGTLLNWTTVDPGATYYCNLTVQNTGNVNVTVYLIVDGLPLGWTETWTGNATLLMPNESVSGDLDLTVPVDAVKGAKCNWDSYIKGEQS